LPLQARLPPIEVYVGAKPNRKKASHVEVKKYANKYEPIKQSLTPQPSGFKINLVRILPSESSGDELEDFTETPRVKKLNLKGLKQDIEVIPKILIDRSSYNNLLARQNTLSARADSDLAVTPR
jgi:hypothetical protein